MQHAAATWICILAVSADGALLSCIRKYWEGLRTVSLSSRVLYSCLSVNSTGLLLVCKTMPTNVMPVALLFLLCCFYCLLQLICMLQHVQLHDLHSFRCTFSML